MKILAAGIFIIILVGVIAFTIKIVKSPEFFKTTETSSVANTNADDKVFIDVQKNFSFSYPMNWKMIDPSKLPGYAPVFNYEHGYVAVSKKTLSAKNSSNEEVETYSSDIPVQDAVDTLVGTSTTIEVAKTEKLTYPSSIPGFIFEYKGTVDNLEVVRGRIYFYRNGTEITYAFSAELISNQSTSTINSTFVGQADRAMRSMVLN